MTTTLSQERGKSCARHTVFVFVSGRVAAGMAMLVFPGHQDFFLEGRKDPWLAGTNGLAQAACRCIRSHSAPGDKRAASANDMRRNSMYTRQFIGGAQSIKRDRGLIKDNACNCPLQWLDMAMMKGAAELCALRFILDTSYHTASKPAGSFAHECG